MDEAIEVAGCLELWWVNKILVLKRVEGRKLREPGTYVYVMFSIKTGRVYVGETGGGEPRAPIHRCHEHIMGAKGWKNVGEEGNKTGRVVPDNGENRSRGMGNGSSRGRTGYA